MFSNQISNQVRKYILFVLLSYSQVITWNHHVFPSIPMFICLWVCSWFMTSLSVEHNIAICRYIICYQSFDSNCTYTVLETVARTLLVWTPEGQREHFSGIMLPYFVYIPYAVKSHIVVTLYWLKLDSTLMLEILSDARTCVTAVDLIIVRKHPSDSMVLLLNRLYLLSVEISDDFLDFQMSSST